MTGVKKWCWRTTNNSALRIYTTTNVATNRIYTLLHDPQYRVAIAWQNTAYNQPPHPGFFIGANMSTPPTPNIVHRRGHAAGSAAGYADVPARDRRHWAVAR